MRSVSDIVEICLAYFAHIDRNTRFFYMLPFLIKVK